MQEDLSIQKYRYDKLEFRRQKFAELYEKLQNEVGGVNTWFQRSKIYLPLYVR